MAVVAGHSREGGNDAIDMAVVAATTVILAKACHGQWWLRPPADQNASASISMTESAPALSVASSEAVLGRRRRTKNLAVASFAR